MVRNDWWRPTGAPVRLFLGSLVLISVIASFLRFWNLENRVLWSDETITVLRAAGYTQEDFKRAFSDGREHTVNEMRVYQGWHSSRKPASVVQSLVLEDPQHPPLFYLLLHFWQRSFGGSVASQRVLSAVFGIALIPAMYWLCLELFRRRHTATIGAALIAVSPFFFAYSHQLREYGLLALCTLVSGALLLRAQRFGTPSLWFAYAASLAIGLYSDLFFALTFLGQALYLFATGPNAARRAGTVALLGALALYCPWIASAVNSNGEVAGSNDAALWTRGAWPLRMLAAKWIFNSGAAFFDLEYSRLWLGIFLAPIFLGLAYALWYVAMKAANYERWFIGSLVFPTSLLFGLGDLVLHAHRSAITRYGILLYLGLLLCMAGMLGYETAVEHKRRVWQATTLGIVAGGLVCCFASSQSWVWWDTHEDDEIIPIAARINAADHPLIVTTSWRHILLLSFRLKNDARAVIQKDRANESAPTGNVFLVTTPEAELKYMSHFERGILLEPLYLGRYSSTWEAFHRPLHDANENPKLSLWQISRQHQENTPYASSFGNEGT